MLWNESVSMDKRWGSPSQTMIPLSPGDDENPKGYQKFLWGPTDSLELKVFKEAATTYGLHSPYVDQILNNWREII